jgi:hypothetical protein
MVSHSLPSIHCGRQLTRNACWPLAPRPMVCLAPRFLRRPELLTGRIHTPHMPVKQAPSGGSCRPLINFRS